MSRRKQPQKRFNKKPNGQNNSEFTIEVVSEPNNVSALPAGQPASKENEDDEILILDAKLDSMGYVRKQMPKDGACLFRAIAESVYSTQTTHRKVRLECVEYLREHRQDFQDFVALPDGQTFDDYLRAMSLDICWGGQIELQALSLLYKKNFEIHSNGEIPPIDNGFKNQIRLCYSYGNHYDLVYTKKQMDYLIFCQELVVDLVAEVLNEPKGDKEFQYENIGYNLWLEDLQNMEEEDRQMAYMLNEENVNACDPESPGFQDVRSKKKRRNDNRNTRQPAPMPVRTSPKPRDDVVAPPSVWGKPVNWAQKFQEPPKPKVEVKEGEENTANGEENNGENIEAVHEGQDSTHIESSEENSANGAHHEPVAEPTKPAETADASQQNPLASSKGMMKMTYAQIMAMAAAKPAEPVKPAVAPAPAKQTPKGNNSTAGRAKQSAPQAAPKKSVQAQQPKKEVPPKEEKQDAVVEPPQPKKPSKPAPVWIGLQKVKEKQAAATAENTATQTPTSTPSQTAEKTAEKPQQASVAPTVVATQTSNEVSKVSNVPHETSQSAKTATTHVQPNGNHQVAQASVAVKSTQSTPAVPEKAPESVKVESEPAPVKVISSVSKQQQQNGGAGPTSAVPKQPITFGPQSAKLTSNLVQAAPFVPPTSYQYPPQQMYPPHMLPQQYGHNAAPYMMPNPNPNHNPVHGGYMPQGYHPHGLAPVGYGYYNGQFEGHQIPQQYGHNAAPYPMPQGYHPQGPMMGQPFIPQNYPPNQYYNNAANAPNGYHTNVPQ